MPRSEVLLVIDDTREEVMDDVAPFYSDALWAIGVSHDIWSTSLLGPPRRENLEPYLHGAVVWAVPDYDPWLWGHPGEGIVTETISWFLRPGGSLFISGQNIAQHFGNDAWLMDSLNARLAEAGSNEIVGAVGSINGVAALLKGGDGANNNYSSDDLTVGPGAFTAVNYGPPAGTISCGG